MKLVCKLYVNKYYSVVIYLTYFKVYYEKSATKVNPLLGDKPKKGKGINSPSVQAFLKKQEMQEKCK